MLSTYVACHYLRPMILNHPQHGLGSRVSVAELALKGIGVCYDLTTEFSVESVTHPLPNLYVLSALGWRGGVAMPTGSAALTCQGQLDAHNPQNQLIRTLAVPSLLTSTQAHG
jgi:hypothetical protein